MAKKANTKTGSDKISSGTSSPIFDMLENISKSTAIVLEKDDSDVSYIDTGVYIFNALMSCSIKNGGIPNNTITVLAGDPQTGKSFILYNVARNAQKDGYFVIFIDTEQSVDKNKLRLFGIETDSSKLALIRSNNVEDLKITLTKMITNLKEQKLAGKEIQKTIILLDSIGQLASQKEIDDANEGKNKADMSRAKAIKSLFRIINSDLGFLNIPLCATNHVYMSMDLFPVAIMSGGKGAEYSASTIVYLSASKQKDDRSDEMSLGSDGAIITAKSRKNRHAKPKKIKFSIDHEKGLNPYDGLELFCTKENFDKVGIAKVKPIKDKAGNITGYENGSKWYVKHLDKTLFDSQLYNSQVFTKEVIDALDPIIKEYFEYGSYEEQQKENALLDAEYSTFEKDEDFDIDELSDDKLFDKE
jgi:RecA/RadA recombinase